MSLPRSPQRRNADPADHREPVVQILAERLLGDLGPQIAVGRRDNTHIDLLVGVRANLANRALVEHAEQRRLEIERHLANLIEENRPAVGLGEGAAPIGDRTP